MQALQHLWLPLVLGAAPLPRAAASDKYYWPGMRGVQEPSKYSVSPYTAPRNLSNSLAWKWTVPKGRFATVFNGGALIDDQMNLYTAAVDAIYKLGPDGRHIWTYHGAFSAVPYLHEGMLLAASKSEGHFIALSMKTGHLIWSTKVSNNLMSDISGLGVKDGVLIGCSHPSPSSAGSGGGHSRVTGVNVTSGAWLWDLQPDSQLWNFMPIFTGEGTFIFQDQIGGIYHVRVATGERLWRAGYKGGYEETWTDGLPMVGPNGIAYAMRSNCQIGRCKPMDPGDVRAYNLSTGELVWHQDVPYVPNSQPVAVGQGKDLTLVMPIGLPASLVPITMLGALWPTLSQFIPLSLYPYVHMLSLILGPKQYLMWGNYPTPTQVRAYDAATGRVKWTWDPPLWTKACSAGDEEGFGQRLMWGVQPYCVPNFWASPSVDARGTIYLGHASGNIFALRDDNGDGKIDDSEVSSYDTGAAFGHPGASIAPGMMAIVSCDTVYVFKE
mmetsp:Transcript_44165/g.136917  ORF Transcript_44165/g.136917 Transcript_44165/m.136917 type:complete len:496 (-) Transcript_44165:62-1549(-)